MALNSSGPLSFGGATTGQSINLELGVSATALASINSTAFRNLAGVASGAISVSNFYGKSNVTYYFIKLTPTSNNPWYDNQLMGIDSAGNYHTVFGTNSGNYTVFAKVSATGSSVTLSGLQITAPGGVYGSTPSGSATNSAGDTVHIASYFMGVYSATTSTGVFPFYVSSAGVPTVAGGLRQYIAPTGQTFSYTASGYSPGAVDASGNFLFIVNGTAYQFTGYDCCGNPIYANNYGGTHLFKYNSSGNNLSQHRIGNNGSSFQYSTEPVVLPSGDLILGGFTYNQLWGYGRFTSSVSSAPSWTNRFSFAAPWSGNPSSSGGPGFTVYNSSTGAMYSSVPFPNASNSGRVAPTVSSINVTNGNFNWAVAAYSTVDNQYTNGLTTDSSGNVYLATFNYYPTLPQNKITVLKFNSSGTLQWQRSFQNDTNSLGIRMIKVTPQGVLALYFYVNPSFGTATYYMTYPLDGSKTGAVATVAGSTITVGTGILTVTTLTPTKNSNIMDYVTPSLNSNGLSSNTYSPTATVTAATY